MKRKLARGNSTAAMCRRRDCCGRAKDEIAWTGRGRAIDDRQHLLWVERLSGDFELWRLQILSGPHNEPGPAKEAPLGNEHFVNFIECMRSRKTEDLHAPIREGYLSTTLVHLANASYRLGRTIHFDPATESVIGDSEATAMLKGTYRHPFVVPEHV